MDDEDPTTVLPRLWHRLTWRISKTLTDFVIADQESGQLRLMILLVLISVLALGGRQLEGVSVPEDTVQDWLDSPTIGWLLKLLKFFLPEFLYYLLSLIDFAAIRHWYPPVFAALLAFSAGAFYLQDIFELKKFWGEAARYLFYSLFGFGYPTLPIRDGQRAATEGPANLINLIGGPGHVNIQLGNAALFERVGGPSAVHGAGKHFVGRFETIREIVSLEDQHGYNKEEAKAVTKDGIPVTVRDLESTFRIRTGGRARTEDNPYPYSPAAISKITYDKTISDKGPSVWRESVTKAVSGKVTGWVASHLFDEATAPKGENADKIMGLDERTPRHLIREVFNKPETRKQFTNMGVEVLLVNIGHIGADPTEAPQVDEQRIATWRAKWKSLNRVTQAQAEGLEIYYKLLARAEAQADTIKAFTQVMQDAMLKMEPGTEIDFDEIVLLYAAQILDAMAESPVWLFEKVALGLKSSTSSANRLDDRAGVLLEQQDLEPKIINSGIYIQSGTVEAQSVAAGEGAQGITNQNQQDNQPESRKE